jgi:hypothetical protein
MAIYRGPGGTGDSATGEDVFGPNSSITNLSGITGSILTPTFIRFADDAVHTAYQGELTWNVDEGTLDLGLNEGQVILQIGQEMHYRVINQSGTTIPNGSLVMYDGSDGNSGKLKVTLWDGTSPTKNIMGISTEEILNGENGYVTHFGKVRGIQTNGANYGETWVDGDILYADSISGLTKVLPEAPNSKTPVAIVVNSHVSNGALFVRVSHGSNLGEDELVELASLADKDLLQYNSVTGRFENKTLLAAGVQAYSANLDEFATVNPTPAGLALLDDADASAQRTTLGLGTLATQSGTFSGTSSGTNTGDQNLFGTIAVSGQSNVVADTTSDTLTLVAGTNISITTDATTDAITINASATGIPDGDKGDITVSGTGSIWTVDNDAITYAKIQNVSATDKLLGRSTAGAGDIEEITCTTAGRALIDDVDNTAQRTTLGLGTIATQNSSSVSITGGTITGITDLAIADGGTGASDAATAFSNLKQAATDTTTGVVELATNAEAATGTDTTRAITPSSLFGGLNATGTAPIYACRAWVSFDGTGTVSILGSGNVSSVTDTGVGSYIPNLTTAMSDTNYAVIVNGNATSAGTTAQVAKCNVLTSSTFSIKTVSTTPTAVDWAFVYAAVFG